MRPSWSFTLPPKRAQVAGGHMVPCRTALPVFWGAQQLGPHNSSLSPALLSQSSFCRSAIHGDLPRSPQVLLTTRAHVKSITLSPPAFQVEYVQPDRAALPFTGVGGFYKLKACPCSSTTTATCCVEGRALLPWSGAKPAVSPR